MRPAIQVASGRFVDFNRFTPDRVQIDDIAHSLSMLCRFTGHCREFYSVAQHSVLVSYLVPPEHALAGLLHDATEAYINDLSRPVKRNSPEYTAMEKRLWPVIADRFGLPHELPECVHTADNLALVTERRDLMPDPIDETDEWAWAKDILPLEMQIMPLPWQHAKRMFRARFASLTDECLAPKLCGCRACNVRRVYA